MKYLVSVHVVPLAACERLDSPGFKHHSSVIREIVSAESLKECSLLCERSTTENLFHCATFSFRASREIDNCFLSEIRVDQIVSSKYLLADPSWDLFENLRGGEECSSSSSSNGKEGKCTEREPL